MALFALTNFIPGKKTLVKSLVKNSNKDGIIRELIKNNVPESIAIQYSPFLASAKTSKEVKGILSQIDETLKLTKEIVPEKNISRSVVGDDIVEVTTKNGVIEMPTLKKSGDISIQTSKQSAKDVQHLISLKNKANTIRTKTLLREKEQILKQGFKSTLQKEQEAFANKMINVVKKFKEVQEKLKQDSKTLLLETKQAGKLKSKNLQEVKNSLFKIAKENIPDKKISKQLTKKLVEAGDSPAKIRNVILAISREKDNIIKKQLKESIKDIVKKSDSFTLIQKEKVAATIDKIRMTGISKDVEKKITERTKAIIVVHYAGVSCDMVKLMEIANKNNILVIEDAAQAVNAKYKGKYLGTIGHMGCYSFHETKNYVAGEGGALLINIK